MSTFINGAEESGGGASATAATPSTNMARDSNANTALNNLLMGYATTATAAGTTTLTVASANTQYFTGVTTQTVVMPVTSTLSLGFRFRITNLSTGNLTVNSSGANLIATIPPNMSLLVACILTSGTTAASWNAGFEGIGSASAGRTFIGEAQTAIAGSADTTLTLTPSATLTDGIYEVDFSIDGVSSGTTFRFFINADTTNTNYRNGYSTSGLGSDNSDTINSTPTTSPYILAGKITMQIKNGVVSFVYDLLQQRPDYRNIAGVGWHISATTITSIQFTASVASDIGIGSFISLRRVA